MTPTNLIPFLPENAPAVAKPLEPLTILIGSQTGTSEKLAKRLGNVAGNLGFAPTLHDMSKYPTAQLPTERNLLVITSTFGDGEPPDSAKAFWQILRNNTSPILAHTRFSVCALGDSNYAQFCALGKNVDAALEKLGGQRISPRADCDLDYEQDFEAWSNSALAALVPAPASPAPATAFIRIGTDAEETRPKHDRNNPFKAPLLVSRRLNGEGSAKDTRHIAFSLAGSDLAYEAGDALGVMPANCPELVDELVAALGAKGDQPVPLGKDREAPLREALLAHYEIARISPALLKHFANKTGDALLVKVSSPDTNGELTRFLRGSEVIDLLRAYPQVTFSPAEFVALLKKLQPRLYSIASSPNAHPGEVHLCVGIVRYESIERTRKGVCSTFLADRLAPGSHAPVYVHVNPNFRSPADPTRPLIMVGPGTGIAPFRAFLEERMTTGAQGRNE